MRSSTSPRAVSTMMGTPRPRAELANERQAIAIGHLAIEEDGPVGTDGERFLGLSEGCDMVDDGVVAAQGGAQRGDHLGLIFKQQNAQGSPRIRISERW